MQMRLCAAQLLNCDVLILDEPTGCMDVDNIGLLEDRKFETSWFVEMYLEMKAH